jgi:pSer/pThr/pTyr-binding forkhead associated (FHA) protein
MTRTTASLQGSNAQRFDADPIVAIRRYGTTQEWPLFGPVLIGRGAECGIRLDSVSASKVHASISRVDGRLKLKDEGSRNGVFIDGVKVDGAELKAGDMFDIGDVRLVAVSSRMQVLRQALSPFVGWSALSQTSMDSLVVATIKRRDVVLTSEPGAVPWRIARLIHKHGPLQEQPLIERSEVPADIAAQRAILDSAENGMLVVPLSALPRGSLVESEVLNATRRMCVVVIAADYEIASPITSPRLSAAMQARVPPLALRPEDRLRLVPLLVDEHAARFPDGELPPEHVAALLRLPWRTFDDLSTAVLYLSALKAKGSLRKAEQQLRLSKSALQRWLRDLDEGAPAALDPPRPDPARRR